MMPPNLGLDLRSAFFSPLPSALAFTCCPLVSWRYWSLPRPVGRRRTLGDLYAISWRPGADLGEFVRVLCLVPAPCLCMPLYFLPCLLHADIELRAAAWSLACGCGKFCLGTSGMLPSGIRPFISTFGLQKDESPVSNLLKQKGECLGFIPCKV